MVCLMSVLVVVEYFDPSYSKQKGYRIGTLSSVPISQS